MLRNWRQIDLDSILVLTTKGSDMARFTDLDDQEKFLVVEVMDEIGGSFASYIARAWRHADSGNKHRLESAFLDLFHKYAHYNGIGFQKDRADRQRLRDSAEVLLDVVKKAQELAKKQQLDGTTFEEVSEFIDTAQAALAIAGAKP